MSQQGWECPKCGRCYSPFVQECLAHNVKDGSTEVEAAGKIGENGPVKPCVNCKKWVSGLVFDLCPECLDKYPSGIGVVWRAGVWD